MPLEWGIWVTFSPALALQGSALPRAPSGPQVDLHQPPHGVHAVEDPQRQAKVDDGEPRPVAIEVLFQAILKLRVDAESRHHP